MLARASIAPCVNSGLAAASFRSLVPALSAFTGHGMGITAAVQAGARLFSPHFGTIRDPTQVGVDFLWAQRQELAHSFGVEHICRQLTGYSSDHRVVFCVAVLLVVPHIYVLSDTNTSWSNDIQCHKRP